tara:strand:- start:93 stop:200 length:108 start_codon:yes stop_codon:yes gene_type:complete
MPWWSNGGQKASRTSQNMAKNAGISGEKLSNNCEI